MALKALFAAVAALAIAVGLALPVPHSEAATAKSSQIATFEIGHG